jgi:hypothetical protein
MMSNPWLSQGLGILAAVVALALCWSRAYQPITQAYRRHQQAVSALQSQLRQLETELNAAGGQAMWWQRQQQKLTDLKLRFPDHQQLPELISRLIATVGDSGLRLVNVAQGNLELVQAHGAPVQIRNAPCYQVGVTVQAEGRFHAVVAAVERLTDERFPVVVAVRQVELAVKETSETAVLSALIELQLYVVGSSVTAVPL